MQFRYYDPARLVPIFRDRGFVPFFYMVCPGCVYTGVPPEDCIRDREEMVEGPYQSDSLCEHCAITSEDMEEAIHFGQDPSVSIKIAELERIIELARGE